MSSATDEDGHHPRRAAEGARRSPRPALLLGGRTRRPRPPGTAPCRGTAGSAGMNVLVFLTDQQRAVQHFPPGWAKRNMPGLTRLQQHGMTFENAFTNACMCSPARSTLMSGYFPAQHGVKYTLETDMPAPQYPQVELATSFKNPATVVARRRLHARLQGQVPLQQAGERLDLGARRRQPVRLHALGSAGRRRQPGRRPRRAAAIYDNDGRFMNSQGTPDAGTEGARPVPQLDGRAAAAVLHGRLAGQPARRALLPEDLRRRAATTTSWLQGEIEPPATVERGPLDQADRAGAVPAALQRCRGRSRRAQMKRNYLNFYGNLMKSSDAYLVKILDTLAKTGPARQHARDRDRRPRRDGHRARRACGRRTSTSTRSRRASRSSTPTRACSRSRRPTTRWSRTSTSCRRWRASSARRPTRATALGRASTTPTRSSAARPKPPQDYTVFTYDDFQSGQAQRPVPAAAEPHRQHPRAALQARPLLRRRRQRARPVGDVRPQGRPARARQPRLQGPQAHAPSRSASTGGCGASSPASSRRGCSR